MSEPVLTSSWCTAWGSYNTPRLWAMVKDEDDPEAWRQVAAWGAISGAMKDQRALLVNAREALVAAWPPEQNKSSEAFVREVDVLIARMDAAKTEADDTATGLANILEALRQAKNHIQPLWEQYKDKSDDLVPSWWDNAEDELDEQARAHMVTAEQIVQDNVARLRVPDPYALEPTDPHYQPTPLVDDGSGDSSGAVGAGGSAGGRSAGGVTVPVPHDPVPPLPGHEPTVPDGLAGPTPDGPPGGSVGSVVGSGPGLAGVINPPVGPPPPVNPPPGGGLPPGGGPLPGGGPGIVPPTGPISGTGTGIGGVGSGRGRPPGRRATSPGFSEPGLPGAGGGVSGLGAGGVGRGARPGPRPEAAGRRALPSGAVIGETVAGEGRGGAGRGGGVGAGLGRGAPQGRGSEPVRPPRPSWLPDEPVGAARAAGVPGPGGQARGGRRAGAGEQQSFHPDNPWEVAEGVDPVIAPGVDTARHDPGPNVIGRHG